MLSELHISDFTLVSSKALIFDDGLTALTGETGAGKSILLDALALALGGKADGEKVRPGAERAEVSALFDISQLQPARQWLLEHELGEEECILRRVVSAEGRSRNYINGRPVTLTQLRQLADRLIDIHSQHEHQRLLKNTHHRYLLDEFANHTAMLGAVKTAFSAWQDIEQKYHECKSSSDEQNARYQLLSYQVQELEELGLSEGELAELEEKQKALANAEQIAQVSQQVYDACAGSDEAIQHQLSALINQLQNVPFQTKSLQEALNLLNTAAIHVDEAASELQQGLSEDSEDVYELPQIEERLTAIYDIARKHRVSPEELFDLCKNLSEELAGLKSGDEQLEELESARIDALATYKKAAAALSESRQKSAKQLSKAIAKQLEKLAMGKAQFEIALTPNEAPTRHGAETIEFLISTVPGKAPKPLAKVASGGELSRISLAIVVVTAKSSITPTLVFDEVDVGIGGATGDVVGQMLRELGESGQVLCVTHLAQVASKAHHHFRVEKTLKKKSVSSEIIALNDEDKVLEIARMMGGDIASEQSLAHAREMLSTAE